MKRLALILLVLSAFGFRTTAQVQPSDNFFNCHVPVGVDGYINIFKMISALSSCAGLNPELLLDDPLRTEIIDFGTYEVVYSEDSTDKPRKVAGIAHLSWGKEIPLKEDLIFGFRAYFSGVIDGTDELIEIHVIRPVDSGTENEEPVEEVSYKTLSNGQMEMVLFHISTEDEMVPGIWTFEIHHKGRIIASQRLNLIL